MHAAEYVFQAETGGSPQRELPIHPIPLPSILAGIGLSYFAEYCPWPLVTSLMQTDSVGKLKSIVQKKAERIQSYHKSLRQVVKPIEEDLMPISAAEKQEMEMGDCGYKSLPDNVFATGGADHRVALWDMAEGKMLRNLVGHERKVTALSFFKDRSPENGGGPVSALGPSTTLHARCPDPLAIVMLLTCCVHVASSRHAADRLASSSHDCTGVQPHPLPVSPCHLISSAG